jgi:hypothetical protein
MISLHPEMEFRLQKEPVIVSSKSLWANTECREKVFRGLLKKVWILLPGLLLAGCERTPTNLPDEPVPPATTVETVAPKRLLIDLYFDTSFSVRGFAGQSSGTNQDLEKLEEVLGTMAARNPGNLVRRWRFAPGPASEDGWLNIANPGQNLDPNEYASRDSGHPRLSDLFSSSSSATRFTIVVTDLRLDLGDPVDLARRLSQQITWQDRGLGICSVRLPFDGQIDLAAQPEDFKYHGPRRIYVLFFGSRAVVNQFAQSLRVEMQRQFIDADLLVIGPRIVNQTFDSGAAAIDRLVGLRRLTANANTKLGKLLIIESLPDTVDGSIEVSVPLDRSPDGPVLSPQMLDMSPAVFIWRSSQWEEIHPDKINLQYEKRIQRSDTPNKSEQRLVFDLAVAAPAFFTQGWYYLDFRIRAKPSDLELPTWTEDADLPGGFWQRNATTGETFQGRTPELREFLTRLQRALPSDTQELGNVRILLKRWR